MRIAAIWALALFMAVLSSVHAMSNIAASDTLAFIFPENGLALASVSENRLRQEIVSNDGALPAKLNPDTVALAEQAFQTEPLSDKAIRIIALGRAGEGQNAEGRGLMRNLAKLTKRDQAANFWLIKDYGDLGDIDSLLKFYDISLRGSRVASGQLLPAMAKAMENAAFVQPFVELLSNRPPWSEQFWSQLVNAEDAYSNTVLLREKLEQKDIRPSKSIDKLLVSQLAQKGYFEDALALRQIISGNVNNSNEVLANSNFQEEPIYPPFDWQLFSEGKHSTAIDDSAGELIVSTSPGARGTVARQLVSLTPGQYVINSALVEAKPPAAQISFKLRCAEKNRKNNALLSVLVEDEKQRNLIDVGSVDCKYFWFDVDVSVRDEGQRSDIIFNKIALTELS